MQLIYDTLLVKNEQFDLVPSLAESFEESADSQDVHISAAPRRRLS